MPIHLVRHAHAGRRSEWDGDDRERPLSRKGGGEALWLRDLLVEAPVRRVVSSPFLRCVQTVQPLADALGLPVERSDALAEGADADDALDLLLSLEPDAGVACAHGDLVPVLLRRLVQRGMAVDVPLLDAKGSVWVVEVEGGVPRRARYVPPRS